MTWPRAALVGVAALSLLWLGFEWLEMVRDRSLEAPRANAVLSLRDVTVDVEIADTPAARTQGLSGRHELAPGTGMLFVFDRPDTYGFWMPDMYFSIDILWLDVNKRVVHIEPDVSPESYPESFSPPAPALYVLEVPSGWSREHGISVGDRATW